MQKLSEENVFAKRKIIIIIMGFCNKGGHASYRTL
jgi:hypothetical protein